MCVFIKIILYLILHTYTFLVCLGALVWVNATAYIFYFLSKIVLFFSKQNRYNDIFFILPFNTYEQWKKYISLIATFIKETSFSATQSMLYYKFKCFHPAVGMSLPYFKFPAVKSDSFFYLASDFEELSHLLSNKEMIKNEYTINHHLLKPYTNEAGNQHHDWNTILLYGSGILNAKIANSFPVTMQCLNAIENLETSMILFSVLQPGAHIPIHTGPFNSFLRVHLPLILPNDIKKCNIKVGTEYKYWNENELLIFDDSFEHSVSNETSEVRVILMLSIWKKDISEKIKNNINELIILLNSSPPFKKWMEDNS